MSRQTSNPVLEPQRLYTKAAASRLMGVGLDTVKRLLNEGKLEQAEQRGPNKWATITGSSIIRFTRIEQAIDPMVLPDKPTVQELREYGRAFIERKLEEIRARKREEEPLIVPGRKPTKEELRELRRRVVAAIK